MTEVLGQGAETASVQGQQLQADGPCQVGELLLLLHLRQDPTEGGRTWEVTVGRRVTVGLCLYVYF